VCGWLGEQSGAFRKRIEIAVIDASAPDASIRVALPEARVAIDIWHLVAVDGQMVTEVRQRCYSNGVRQLRSHCGWPTSTTPRSTGNLRLGCWLRWEFVLSP
jgi:hypothetical protein